MPERKSSRRDLLKGGLALVAGSLAQACGGKLASPGPADADALAPADAASAPPPADACAAALDAGAQAPDADPADAGEAPDADPGAPDAAAPDAGAPPVPRPTTTVRARIQGLLSSEPQPASLKMLWGVTQSVPGDAHVRIDLLGADATASAPSGDAASLLYLAHLTDIHVIDEESPARTISLDGQLSAAWRSQEAHSAQVLDAMVRKLRALDAVRPLDFTLVTGDLIDNNQTNELGWFLDVAAGGPLQPNSGALEDPVPGPNNDPHDAMVAMGLGEIPWYAVPGNHDLLIQGNLPKDFPLNYSLGTGDPTRGTIGPHDTGRVNPPACNPIPPDEAPSPWRCIPTDRSLLTTGDLPPDLTRVHLPSAAWFAGVAAAPGLPLGHGYGVTLAADSDGDYVVDPVPGLPLRLVVLNTVAAIGAEGDFPDAKISGFLGAALDKAEADRVLVIVASHHPSDSITSTAADLRARLNACPNVVLHLVGHTHQNLVTPRPGATPQLGYWEVTTSGLVEWPQQARLVELVDNRDGTAELWLTLVDYGTDHVPLGAIVEGSRFLSMWEVHSGARGSGTAAEGGAIDRNVVLPVALTPELRARLAEVAGKPIESKLFA